MKLMNHNLLLAIIFLSFDQYCPSSTWDNCKQKYFLQAGELSTFLWKKTWKCWSKVLSCWSNAIMPDLTKLIHPLCKLHSNKCNSSIYFLFINVFHFKILHNFISIYATICSFYVCFPYTFVIEFQKMQQRIYSFYECFTLKLLQLHSYSSLPFRCPQNHPDFNATTSETQIPHGWHIRKNC